MGTKQATSYLCVPAATAAARAGPAPVDVVVVGGGVRSSRCRCRPLLSLRSSAAAFALQKWIW